MCNTWKWIINMVSPMTKYAEVEEADFYFYFYFYWFKCNLTILSFLFFLFLIIYEIQETIENFFDLYQLPVVSFVTIYLIKLTFFKLFVEKASDCTAQSSLRNLYEPAAFSSNHYHWWLNRRWLSLIRNW